MTQQMFTQRAQIEAWLEERKISNHKIGADLSVCVKGNVDISRQFVAGKILKTKASLLPFLPVNFVVVSGDFLAEDVGLTTLKGCPKIVGGTFSCHNNDLTTLEYGPYTVGAIYDCSKNRLSSLQYVAKIIGEALSCHDNNIMTLEYFPEHVQDIVLCHNNEKLGNIQDTTDFSLLYAEHQKIVNIKKEKALLENSIPFPLPVPLDTSMQSFKI